MLVSSREYLYYFGECWYAFVNADVCWRTLVCIGEYMFERVSVCWRMLACIGECWYLLEYVDVYWWMLVLLHLSFAGCCRMLVISGAHMFTTILIIVVNFFWASYSDTDAFVSSGSAESVLLEPSCEMMRQTQSLSAEAERSWALSQMCGFYQRRCSTSELHSDSCIRIMGESCSSRLLQCSIINTMQNLEPAIEARTEGKNTHAQILLYLFILLPAIEHRPGNKTNMHIQKSGIRRETTVPKWKERLSHFFCML